MQQNEQAQTQEIQLNQEIGVATPVPMRTFPIGRGQWNRLRGRISRCQWEGDRWSQAVSAFFTIMLFGLGLALTAPSGHIQVGTIELDAKTTYWAMAVIGAVCWLIAVLASNTFKTRQRSDIKDALDYMDEIEEPFPS